MRTRNLYILLFSLFSGSSLLRVFDIIPWLYRSLLFLYLVFIPGALLLATLRKKKYAPVQFTVYSVGLSVTIMELLGVILNFSLSVVGVKHPLSETYVFGGFVALMLIIISVSYYLSYDNQGFRLNFNCHISLSALKLILALILMPLLSILGVTILNFYNTSAMIYVLILLLPIFVLMTNSLPRWSYPLLIFSVSLSLIYHTSLVSFYLWGRDIFNEFYIVNLVNSSGIWIPSLIRDPLNSTLSVTILPIIFSKILNIGVVNLFKVVYPLIFAISPVALYKLYSGFFEEKTAVFSVFLIVFSLTFYAEIPQMARVMIAELFLALFLLSLFVDNDHVLSMIFGISLLASHYSTFYFIFFELLILVLILRLGGKISSSRLVFLVALLASASMIWFTSTAEGFVFLKVISYIKSSFWDTMFLLKNLLFGKPFLLTTSPMHIVTMPSPLLLKITKWMYAVLIILLAIGGINSLKYILSGRFGDKVTQINGNYLAFYILGFINLGLVCAFVLIPPISRSITSTRVFHLILFISSPFIIVGINSIITKIPSISSHQYKVISWFLVIFFILNSGILASLTLTPYDDTSIALQANTDWAKFNIGEVAGAKWITHFWDGNRVKILYGDVYGWVLPGEFKWLYCSTLPPTLEFSRGNRDFYIFLRTWNIKTRTLLIGGGRLSGGHYVSLSNISRYLEHKIYDNSKSQVYIFMRTPKRP